MTTKRKDDISIEVIRNWMKLTKLEKKGLHIKYAELQAGLRQVSNYHVEPDKKSTSTEPGSSSQVFVSWKKKRIEEIKREIRELEDLMGEEE